MSKKIAMILTGCFILMMCSSCSRWIIYHKPEYKGKIIDVETREPIEGSVIAVYYEKDVIGGLTPTIHWVETLTDHNGNFIIPSYTTLIQPLSFESDARFIIYKPGYASYPLMVEIINPEELFLPDMSGQKADRVLLGGAIHFTYGVAELRKLKTREERIRALGIPSYGSPKEFPILYKLMDEEWGRLGLGEVR